LQKDEVSPCACRLTILYGVKLGVKSFIKTSQCFLQALMVLLLCWWICSGTLSRRPV